MTDDAVTRGLKALQEPFGPDEISKLPKNLTKDDRSPKVPCSECKGYHVAKVIHLDYVGHAALTRRLLEVDPRWTWEPFAVDEHGLPLFDRNGGLWIRLTVLGVTRIGYGDAPGKNGGNAVKEAIGDALRNSGMRFGAALDLWHKGELPEPRPEYDDPGPLIDAIAAATTSAELDEIGRRIASATLLRADRAEIRAKGTQRRHEINTKETTNAE